MRNALNLTFVLLVVGCIKLATSCVPLFANVRRSLTFCTFFTSGILIWWIDGGKDATALHFLFYVLWSVVSFTLFERIRSTLPQTGTWSISAIGRLGMCWGLALATIAGLFVVIDAPLFVVAYQMMLCALFTLMFTVIEALDRAWFSLVERYHITWKP